MAELFPSILASAHSGSSAEESFRIAPDFQWLGLQPYLSVWEVMRFSADRIALGEAAERVLSCEHPPVFTTGKRSVDNRLMLSDIPFVQTDRGGETTFHGPGQLMLYPIINLRYRRLGVRNYINLLEQSCIDLLIGHGLKAVRKRSLPGVWVGGAKVAAIGLRVRNGVCYHGMGLNVDVSLQYFLAIDPCGLKMPVTNVSEHLAATPPVSHLAVAWNAHFMQLLQTHLHT